MKSKAALTVCWVLIISAGLVTSSVGAGLELGFKAGAAFSRLPMDHTYFVEAGRFPELWGGSTDDFASGYKRGFCLGAFVTVSMFDSLDLQFEIIWAHRGGKVEGTADQTGGPVHEEWALKETVDLEYLEFPLLLKIRGGRVGPFGTRFLVGPYADLRVNRRDDLEVTVVETPPRSPSLYAVKSTADIVNVNSAVDYGLIVGFELEWSIGRDRMFLDFRYAFGLRSEFTDTSPLVQSSINYDKLFIQDYRPLQIAMNDARTGDASGFKNRSFYLTVGFSFDL